MTDTTTKKPLRVSASTAGPYIMLPLSQLDDLKRLLNSRGITYWTDENALSWNGDPYTLVVHFGHNGDASLVQTILDGAP